MIAFLARGYFAFFLRTPAQRASGSSHNARPLCVARPSHMSVLGQARQFFGEEYTANMQMEVEMFLVGDKEVISGLPAQFCGCS